VPQFESFCIKNKIKRRPPALSKCSLKRNPKKPPACPISSRKIKNKNKKRPPAPVLWRKYWPEKVIIDFIWPKSNFIAFGNK